MREPEKDEKLAQQLLLVAVAHEYKALFIQSRSRHNPTNDCNAPACF